VTYVIRLVKYASAFYTFKTLLSKRFGCGLAKVNVTEWKIWKIGWYTLKSGESRQSMGGGDAYRGRQDCPCYSSTASVRRLRPLEWHIQTVHPTVTLEDYRDLYKIDATEKSSRLFIIQHFDIEEDEQSFIDSDFGSSHRHP
jgi:hypothetical protein